MDLIARRFRGVLIAIVVLGLSAGAVFAGHVVLQAPATTPTASEQGDQGGQADETDTEAPEAAETPESPDAADQGAGKPTDNHGALVSAAAQMETPAAFAGSHGAFVSCVAHLKALPAGVTDQAAFLAALTPDACLLFAQARATDKADRLNGKAGKHGKGHNR